VLTECHSQQDVPASQCPPYWWTLRQRLGLRTAWRAPSKPPAERRCRGIGSSPRADEQRESVRHKKTFTSPTDLVILLWYRDFKAMHEVILNLTYVKVLANDVGFLYYLHLLSVLNCLNITARKSSLLLVFLDFKETFSRVGFFWWDYNLMYKKTVHII